ncbi:farnesyl pyrophosphate synthase-like [Dysidea avara]|uniref:farnesyl pyrophosphate synthase-like n=1 Tax=Dysidea avara TaxID=196820 RepID=UPI003330BF57
MPLITPLLATSWLLSKLFRGQSGGRNFTGSKTGKRYMKQYRDKFVQYFPTLVTELTQRQLFDSSLKHGVEHLKEVVEYNVMGGKMNRGLMVVVSLCHLVGDRPLTAEEERLAFTLGWCIELMQGAFLVADDIMDHSLTRRGKPCWYKQKHINLLAVIDSLWLEGSIFNLLKKNFHHQPCYADLLDLFHSVEDYTETGQTLDLLTAPEDRIDFTQFTPERYQAIVVYKTAYYSFCLPVRAAMYMVGINDKESHEMAEKILIEMGEFFQIQDDYLDCYGDPKVTGKVGTDIEDNKCSWLVVQALSRATSDQRALLEVNYARNDASCVEKVKELYEVMNIKQLYFDYEDNSYQKLSKLVDQCGQWLPPDLFLEYMEKLYKRNV